MCVTERNFSPNSLLNKMNDVKCTHKKVGYFQFFKTVMET